MLDYRNCITTNSNRRNSSETYPWLVTKNFEGCCFNVYSDGNNSEKVATIGITDCFCCSNSNEDCSGYGDKGSWQAWYLEESNITNVTRETEVLHTISRNPVLSGIKVNCSVQFNFLFA